MFARPIVIVGSEPGTTGRVGLMLKLYREAGLFERLPIKTIRTVTEGGRFANLAQTGGAALQLLRLLLRRDVNLAHIQLAENFYRKSLFVRLVRVFRRPVIVHLHGNDFFEYFEHGKPRRQEYVQRVLASVQCIVLQTERHRRRMADIAPGVRLEVLPNASRAIAVQTELREVQHFLFLGRVDRDSGIDDVLRAIAVLAADYPALKLTCAGNGERDWLRQQAEAYEIADRVTACSHVWGTEKERLLSQAGALVFPAHAETQTVSLIEALAAGLPVIATAVGATPEIVEDGKQGILYAPGDVAALADAVRKLCDGPDAASEMGVAGQFRWHERFSITAALAQLELLYKDLTA